MSKTEKIIVFYNEVEARLLDGLLNERGIPHVVKSYYDSAYDGMWQTQFGWGHLEAPPEFRDEIIRIYSGMSSDFETNESQDTEGQE